MGGYRKVWDGISWSKLGYEDVWQGIEWEGMGGYKMGWESLKGYGRK